jgi:hypothetical protein
MADDTASPARNFTVTTEEKVRALMGPPAYMRRRRDIEDLEENLLKKLRAGKPPESLDLRPINDLIDRHNRYYPVEANLPIDPQTGVLLELGRPWKPMPKLTIETLLAKL